MVDQARTAPRPDKDAGVDQWVLYAEHLEALVEEAKDWFAKAQPHLDGAIAIGWIHGQTYEGPQAPPWMIEATIPDSPGLTPGELWAKYGDQAQGNPNAV